MDPSLDERALKKKVYARWVTHYTAPFNITITDLVEDLRDGTVLLLLLKILTKKDPVPELRRSVPSSPQLSPSSSTPPALPEKSVRRSDRIANVHSALLFLSRNAPGISLSHLSAEEIVNGKMAAVFDLVYEIIREFELRPLLGPRLVANADLGSLEHQAQALVRYVSSLLQSYPSSLIPAAFPTDFGDGLVLASILHATHYSLIDLYAILNSIGDAPSPGEALLDAGFAVAADLGVPRLLDPPDVRNINYECFVAYLATALNIIRDRAAQSADLASLPPPRIAEILAENKATKDANAQLKARLQSVDTIKANLASEYAVASDEKDHAVRAARSRVDELSTKLNELRSQLATAVAANDRLQASLTMLTSHAASAASRNNSGPNSSHPDAVAPPSGANVTLVATRIYGNATLWDSAPELMVQAESVLVSTTRSLISDLHAFEASFTDGKFLVAFDSPVRAVLFAMRLQLELLDAPWPSDLTTLLPKQYVGTEQSMDHTSLFRGLRVATGIHTGNPTLRSATHPITGIAQTEYVGADVTIAKLLAASARGGQTVISSPAYSLTAKKLNSLEFAVHDSSLGKFALDGELSMKGALYSLLPEYLAHRRFDPFVLKGASAVAMDSAGSALSSTERKFRLLQERNSVLSKNLKSLSAKVGSANDYALKLASKLRAIHSDPSSATSSSLSALVDELDAVMERQDKLSSEIASAVAARDVLDYELTDVKDTLASERKSIADSLAVAYASQNLPANDSEGVPSRKSRSRGNSISSSGGAPGTSAGQVIYRPDPKVLKELEDLQASFKKATRVAAAKEIGLKEKLRNTRKALKTAESEIQVLSFKVTHGMYDDPAVTLPLHSILNDDGVDPHGNAPFAPTNTPSSENTSRGGGPQKNSPAPRASASAGASLPERTRRHSVAHVVQIGKYDPSPSSSSSAAAAAAVNNAGSSGSTNILNGDESSDGDMMTDDDENNSSFGDIRLPRNTATGSRFPVLPAISESDGTPSSAPGSGHAALAKLDKRTRTKLQARLAVFRMFTVAYTRPLQEMYSNKTELARGHALALCYDTLTSILKELLILFPGTIDFLYCIKVIGSALRERYAWLTTARDDVTFAELVGYIREFCTEQGVFRGQGGADVARKFETFFKPPGASSSPSPSRSRSSRDNHSSSSPNRRRKTATSSSSKSPSHHRRSDDHAHSHHSTTATTATTRDLSPHVPRHRRHVSAPKSPTTGVIPSRRKRLSRA